MDFTEEQVAREVKASFAGAADDRFREVMQALAGHLHAFVREVEPSYAEWEAAIDFLTRTGQACTGTRQEFILLSDVLGVSTLVDAINNRASGPATESTVLGPFHVAGAPARALGDDIALDGQGEPCVVTGTVRDLTGAPLPGATVDVWQASTTGFYDVQQPGEQPRNNLRGVFTADGEGAFWFRTVVPRYYPIPDDGPVGQLLKETGRHPYRPAHIHFIAGAPGHRPVTTHLFVADSPYLDSDAVFAVKQSLIRDFAEVNDPDLAAEYGVANPFRHAHFDIALEAT
jgi:protocatechuate 3,4-dioxygenase beta subunit